MNHSISTLDFQEVPSQRMQHRSLESPTVSLNDPSAFDFLGIGTQPIAAGVRVDRRSVLTLDSWWRGVCLISGTLSRLPVIVYKGDKIGNNTPDRNHQAFRLLFQKPNDYQDSNYWKMCMFAHVLNHGNGYSYIDRDGSGRPRALALLAPDRTYPIRVDGKLLYISHVYTDIIGGPDGSPGGKNEPTPTTMMVMDPDDVIHIRGLGYDGLVGYTVFDMAAETAGHGLATRQYAARFFANNAEPRVMIELPAGQNWRPEVMQEFLREWNMMHAGVSNAHRTALLTNGAKVTPYSIDAEKSQLVEQRRFHVKEVANFLGVPPHKLGDDSRSSYNSVEAENQSMLGECYGFWIDRMCRELEMKLLTEREKESYSHFIDFDRTELMRADNKTEAEGWSLKVNNGLAFADEARASMNLPALPDGMGKQVRIPVNIGILTKEGIQGIPQNQGDMKRPEGTPKPADKKSLSIDEIPGALAVVHDASERIYTRLSKDCQRAAAKPDKFSDWKETAFEAHQPALAKILAPSVQLYGCDSALARRIANETIKTCLAACGDEAKFHANTAQELFYVHAK